MPYLKVEKSKLDAELMLSTANLETQIVENELLEVKRQASESYENMLERNEEAEAKMDRISVDMTLTLALIFYRRRSDLLK